MHVPSLAGLKIAFIAPVVGGAVIIASIIDSPSNADDGVWKTLISMGLGIFITLVGVIYYNMKESQSALERRLTKIEENSISRYEIKLCIDAIDAQLSRIENHLVSIDNRNIWKSGKE